MTIEVVSGTQVKTGDEVSPLYDGLLDSDLAVGSFWESVVETDGVVITTLYHNKVHNTVIKQMYGTISSRLFLRRM